MIFSFSFFLFSEIECLHHSMPHAPHPLPLSYAVRGRPHSRGDWQCSSHIATPHNTTPTPPNMGTMTTPTPHTINTNETARYGHWRPFCPHPNTTPNDNTSQHQHPTPTPTPHGTTASRGHMSHTNTQHPHPYAHHSHPLPKSRHTPIYIIIAS